MKNLGDDSSADWGI